MIKNIEILEKLLEVDKFKSIIDLAKIERQEKLKEQRIVYLSGSISNTIHFEKDFENAEEFILQNCEGYSIQVLNPIKLEHTIHSNSYENNMIVDVFNLLFATDLVTVNNFNTSRGAILEIGIAQACGIKTFATLERDNIYDFINDLKK